MLKDVQVIYGGRTLGPIADQLRANRSGSSRTTGSSWGAAAWRRRGPRRMTLSWDPHARLYFMEPPNPIHHYVHANVPGIQHSTCRSNADIKDSLHDIDGATVVGDLALTTQLSGCTVIYRVAGGSLTVAHINPDAEVRRFVPQDLAQRRPRPSACCRRCAWPATATVAGGGAGTLGTFGWSHGPAETGLRMLGARRVRFATATPIRWGNGVLPRR